MERNVVVTGIGVISPVGSGKDKFWQSLIGGKSGIDRIKALTLEILIVRWPEK